MPRLFGHLLRYLFGVFSCAYLFTLGLLKARNREMIVAITRHFGYGVVKPKLPLVPLNALAGDEADIEVHEASGGDGSISALELIAVIKLIKTHNPRRLFELGTFDGRTTLNMAANSAPEAEVFTLDLPKIQSKPAQLRLEVSDRKYIDKDLSGAKYRGTNFESKIRQVFGDSAAYDFAPFFGTVDLVFVDAAHSYEYVLNDSKIALKLLRKTGGVILWHDYGNWDGVTKAVNELFVASPEFAELKQIVGTTLACLIVRH